MELRSCFATIDLGGSLKLDLFANVIVCKSLPGVEARHKEVDFVIVRQNTEGEYSGLEHEVRFNRWCAQLSPL